jgi:hypothetical protein
MARTAMTELQQQIEAVRREAFAAGYAAAMEAIRELTSRAASGTGTTAAAPSRRGRGRGRARARQAAPAAARPVRRRRATRARTTTRAATRARATGRAATRTRSATRARAATRTRSTRRVATRTRATARTAARTTRTRRSSRRPQRGTNARMIGEILQAAAPRAIRPADIRKALQDRGVAMAFTSIRHALGQLQQRNAAEQIGGSNTWRHRGGAS